MGHDERLHARLSASGAHRWLSCPGSVALEAQFEDVYTDAAAEGTIAHEIAELKLRNYFNPHLYNKTELSEDIQELSGHKMYDKEMLGYTDEYVDVIQAASLRFLSRPYALIEKRVDLSKYIPGGFGTADCILIGGDTLQVIDFKYGKSPDGRVLAEHNPQMMLYALGAYEIYKMFYNIKTIKMTIVQPRLPDGVSEWSCTIEDLLEFGAYAKERATIALSGVEEYHPDAKTCKWCKARQQCRARAEQNVAEAFSTKKLPPLIDAVEVARYLSMGEDVKKWLDDLKDWALKQCLAGNSVPGYKAVNGKSSREWTDGEKAFEELKKNGIKEAILYERKPLTLAQVEKAIGKELFKQYVGQYVTHKVGAPALVVESDKRPAITNKVTAEMAFGKEE